MFSVEFSRSGLLRPLSAAELSDGTLRMLLLIAALLSPSPPGMLVLDEPESSLHPDLYPALADRSSLSQWLSKPGPDMAARAEAEAARLLASHFPTHIAEETDAAIRAAFDIRLPRARMRPVQAANQVA